MPDIGKIIKPKKEDNDTRCEVTIKGSESMILKMFGIE